jgi:GAF domain-containing protein
LTARPSFPYRPARSKRPSARLPTLNLMPDEPQLSPAALDSLASVAGSAPDDTIERALNTAREMLGMDMGYVTHFDEGKQNYAAVEGDGESFDMEAGGSYPLEGSYCQRMVMGRIPNAVNDTSENEELADLELTKLAEIGSYIGVPIEFSDGTLYGTICCASHDRNEALDDRDVKFMQVIARIVADEIEQRQLKDEVEVLRAEVKELKVEIDQGRRERMVDEISETEWFQDLQQRAAELRSR